MERGFSAIAIKSLDDEQRTIRGVASTVEPDRQLDIVEPLGLRFKNPVSLLWQHRHESPVGSCQFERPTKAGINFSARLPKVDEPGTFKDQVDHAWHAVRAGAVRFVSIGFLPLEAEPLNTGGMRFKKAELLELSLVSVPANPGATITEVKALDAAVRRGDVPASAGPLWDQVKAAGLAGLNRAEQDWKVAFQKAATPAERKELADVSHGKFLQGSFHEMLKFLADRVEAAERRLEQRGMDYKGVWRVGHYPAGVFVTHAGSCWWSEKATDRKPGEGDWVLAVKRGADSKERG